MLVSERTLAASREDVAHVEDGTPKGQRVEDVESSASGGDQAGRCAVDAFGRSVDSRWVVGFDY
jgi:hypothetical protein